MLLADNQLSILPQNDLMSLLATGHYTSPQNQFLYSCDTFIRIRNILLGKFESFGYGSNLYVQ